MNYYVIIIPYYLEKNEELKIEISQKLKKFTDQFNIDKISQSYNYYLFIKKFEEKEKEKDDTITELKKEQTELIQSLKLIQSKLLEYKDSINQTITQDQLIFELSQYNKKIEEQNKENSFLKKDLNDLTINFNQLNNEIINLKKRRK